LGISSKSVLEKRNDDYLKKKRVKGEKDKRLVEFGLELVRGCIGEISLDGNKV